MLPQTPVGIAGPSERRSGFQRGFCESPEHSCRRPVARPSRRVFSAFAHCASFEGLRSSLVVGKTADGRYVVADPVSHSGPRLMTRAQLKSFWEDGGGSGVAVWR